MKKTAFILALIGIVTGFAVQSVAAPAKAAKENKINTVVAEDITVESTTITTIDTEENAIGAVVAENIAVEAPAAPAQEATENAIGAVVAEDVAVEAPAAPAQEATENTINAVVAEDVAVEAPTTPASVVSSIVAQDITPEEANDIITDFFNKNKTPEQLAKESAAREERKAAAEDMYKAIMADLGMSTQDYEFYCLTDSSLGCSTYRVKLADGTKLFFGVVDSEEESVKTVSIEINDPAVKDGDTLADWQNNKYFVALMNYAGIGDANVKTAYTNGPYTKYIVSDNVGDASLLISQKDGFMRMSFDF